MKAERRTYPLLSVKDEPELAVEDEPEPEPAVSPPLPSISWMARMRVSTESASTSLVTCDVVPRIDE